MLRMFNSLMYGAQERLSITSPFFVPDDSLLMPSRRLRDAGWPLSCS